MHARHEGLSHLPRTVHPTPPQATIPTLTGWRKNTPLFATHCREDLLLAKATDFVFGEGVLHAANGVLEPSQFVDLPGDEVSVAVEVLLGVEGSAAGLFEEDELRFEVAVVLIVDDWPLESQPHSPHEGLGVRCQVAVSGTLSEHLPRLLLPLLPLLLLTPFRTVKDLQV
jgi:hypothetical protein